MLIISETGLTALIKVPIMTLSYWVRKFIVKLKRRLRIPVDRKNKEFNIPDPNVVPNSRSMYIGRMKPGDREIETGREVIIITAAVFQKRLRLIKFKILYFSFGFVGLYSSYRKIVISKHMIRKTIKIEKIIWNDCLLS